ncbi:MAG: hypothetical protein EZS28_029526 [Streblomastix strix]|uniref:Uncharacterized protein n=1 Tax=Streblomastix strix TaxID=222440 RepID=A0A5J4UWV5_9EUKA|nr:MAG: hypothetical protein EZS28_029526 [Streblomastix strix]
MGLTKEKKQKQKQINKEKQNTKKENKKKDKIDGEIGMKPSSSQEEEGVVGIDRFQKVGKNLHKRGDATATVMGDELTTEQRNLLQVPLVLRSAIETYSA